MKANRIISAIALVGAIFTFLATNSGAALALAVAVALAPIAGLIANYFVARKTTVSLSAHPSCTVGQDMAMEITVQRPFFLRGRLELVFNCENLLLAKTRTLTVSLAPSVARREKYLLPLKTDRCGHIVLGLSNIWATDVMGLAKARVRHEKPSVTYTVYPQISEISVVTEKSSLANISGSTYDRTRKGQDRTEVFDIRDYRNGDSLKSVHWKLSARFNDLLVREPSRPAEHNIILLCDAHAYQIDDTQRAEVLNATLAVLASVSLALVRQGIEHTVVQSDGAMLHTCFVDNRVEFDEMIDSLMDIPLSHSSASDAAPFRMTKRSQPDTKLVLITNLADEQLPAKLSRLADLSVIRVSYEGTPSINELGNYTLTNLPVDAVPETKVLEI